MFVILWSRSCLIFMLSLGFLTAMNTSLSAEDETKNLDRYVDPLIIEGRYFPSMEKLSISGLRLYSYQHGNLDPIPFQLDEISEDGFKVLPDGPEGNPEKGNGLFDKQDELLFMSSDAGDRVEFPGPPINSNAFTEIEIENPLNGKKGWCYLLFFDSHPPDFSPRFYSGITDTNNPTGYDVKSVNMTIKGKRIEHRGKKYNQIFYQEFSTPVPAGGTGVDYVDRLKWRAWAGLFFNMFKPAVDEDNLLGNFLCWKWGPIRGTYRVWANATLPLGLKSPSFVADVVGYTDSISTSTAINAPFNPGYVLTEIVSRMGTDLSPEAYGMMFFNSENLDGFLIDGVMSEEEMTINKKRDTWRLITGPQGTLMNRSTWDESFLEQAAAVEIEYVDDVNDPDPPEFHRGQIGHSLSYAKIKSLKPGKYIAYIEWYWPQHFYDPLNPEKLNLEKVQHYLNYQDNPLTFTIEGEHGINKSRPVPAKKWD